MTPVQYGEEEWDRADPSLGLSQKRTCLKCLGTLVISKPHTQGEDWVWPSPMLSEIILSAIDRSEKHAVGHFIALQRITDEAANIMNGHNRVKILGEWRGGQRWWEGTSGPLCHQHQPPVLIVAKLGAEESGQHTVRNQPSKQQGTHVFVRAGKRVSKLVNGDAKLFNQCWEWS